MGMYWRGEPRLTVGLPPRTDGVAKALNHPEKDVRPIYVCFQFSKAPRGCNGQSAAYDGAERLCMLLKVALHVLESFAT